MVADIKWFQCLTTLWDWVDKRDVDKHVASWAIIYGTIRITEWAFMFAQNHPTLETAAIVAAVTVPYSALQAAALKWYFDYRSQ